MKLVKRLDFKEWLKIANPQQYGYYHKYPDHKPPYCFTRAYIEYLRLFHTGFTKVIKIRNTTKSNFQLDTKVRKRKGNTNPRKYIPFLDIN